MINKSFLSRIIAKSKNCFFINVLFLRSKVLFYFIMWDFLSLFKAIIQLFWKLWIDFRLTYFINIIKTCDLIIRSDRSKSFLNINFVTKLLFLESFLFIVIHFLNFFLISYIHLIFLFFLPCEVFAFDKYVGPWFLKQNVILRGFLFTWKLESGSTWVRGIYILKYI